MTDIDKYFVRLGVAVLLFGMLWLNGCILSSLNPLTVDSVKSLSPEQIQALRDAGQDVYACIKVAGPPPGGNLIYIMVPHGVAYTGTFGDGCAVTR